MPDAMHADRQTAVDHGKCATHRAYLLSCKEFDELLTRSGQRCQICRIPGGDTPAGKLFIDHDCRFGKWAVRGLLCGLCNNRLGRDTVFRPEVEDYLNSTWYVEVLAKQGIVPEIPPEPPVGTRVRDAWRQSWTHLRGGSWNPGSAGRGGLYARSWVDLCRDRGGAHTLTVLGWGDPVVKVELHVEDAQSMAVVLREEIAPEVRTALARLLLEE